MPKLGRVFLALFGNTGPADDFAKFGSQVDGAPVKTKDVALIQSLDAWNRGWKNAILSANRAPYLEDMNAAFFVHSYMTAYLMQEGVPEWDPNTTYFIGGIAKKPGTSELYASLTNENLGNPLPNQTDNANWHFLSTAAIQAGNTAARPASPVPGFVYLNTEVHAIQRYDGVSYSNILVVPDGTITATQLAASVAGSGLSGGGGTPLAVNVDDVGIEISSDALRLKDLGVSTAKLANLGVTTGKIADSQITFAKMAVGAVNQIRNGTNVSGGGGPVWANNIISLRNIAVQDGSSILIFGLACAQGNATGSGRLDLDMAVFRSPTFSGATITGGVLVEGAFSRIVEINIGSGTTRLMNMSLVGIDKNLPAGTYNYALGGGISNGQGSAYGVVFYHLLLLELKKGDVA